MERTMRIDVNGVTLDVEETGDPNGDAVLLVHGWPDTHKLWRHQVAALTEAGYRTIAPDLRGFGGSDKPEAIADYAMSLLVGDLVGILDAFDLGSVHLVGHDWGGALGAVMAAIMPDRVRSLTCLSVGHPAALRSAGWAQREKSWYMLLFQFPGVAEQWLSQDDFRNFREWSGHPEPNAVIERLRDPAALTATLGVYRANLAPEAVFLGAPIELPPIQAPTLGVWSSGDIALTEAAMTGTAKHVAAPWHYERIEGAGHWMQLDQPDRINRLLLDFLSEVTDTGPVNRLKSSA
jgi:pimeloyl-ACP methyl ester carboxylesterase